MIRTTGFCLIAAALTAAIPAYADSYGYGAQPSYGSTTYGAPSYASPGAGGSPSYGATYNAPPAPRSVPAQPVRTVTPNALSDVYAADNAIGIELGAENLRYGESINNATFDTEKGWLPSGSLSYSLLTGEKNSAIFSNLYVSLEGSAALGNEHYDGGLQEFNQLGQYIGSIPYQATTNSDIYEIKARIGHAFPIADTVMLIPFVEGGYRYWQRKLTGAYGYTEEYTNGEAMGGLMVQAAPVSHLVLTLSGAGGSTVAPIMTPGSPSGYYSSGSNFFLKSTPMWEAQAKIGYTFTQNVEATLSVDAEGLGFGASDPAQHGGTYEPDSYTHEITPRVGLSYHLPPF